MDWKSWDSLDVGWALFFLLLGFGAMDFDHSFDVICFESRRCLKISPVVIYLVVSTFGFWCKYVLKEWYMSFFYNACTKVPIFV